MTLRELTQKSFTHDSYLTFLQKDRSDPLIPIVTITVPSISTETPVVFTPVVYKDYPVFSFSLSSEQGHV